MSKQGGRLNIRIDEAMLDDLKEVAWMMGPDSSVSGIVRLFLDQARGTIHDMAEVARAARRGDASAAEAYFQAIHQNTLAAARQFDHEMQHPLAGLGELAQQQRAEGEPDAEAS